MKNFLCCFGFRDRPSLRASLVEDASSSRSDRKNEGYSQKKNEGGNDDGCAPVVVVPSSTLTSTSLARPAAIPFVRVDSSPRGKESSGATISRGEAPSPSAVAALLGVAERDVRILLPPASAAAPPPPAALLVRRRRKSSGRETEGSSSSLLLLVALEGVRLSIDFASGSALVFSCPARPCGALDGCREPALDDPLVAALADAAAARVPPSSSSTAPADADSIALGMLECALEAVSLALEERATALEAEAAAAGDALLLACGGGGRKKSSAKSAPAATSVTTREALEGLRRVKGELTDLRAAAARVSGALAPSRSRQRALLGVSRASGGGRQSQRNQKQRQRRHRGGGGGGTLSTPAPSLTWYEEAAEAAAARAGAAALSAEASGAGARGAESAARLSLRRFGTMALFI